MPLHHSISSGGVHNFYAPHSGKYLSVSSSALEVLDSPPPNYTQGLVSTISCILGVIKLKINKYIIVVDKHETVGSIMGSQIARVKTCSIHSVGSTTISLKDPEEAQYLKLLNIQLNNATLYFSVDNEYDLTNSLQRQLGGASPALPDERFWWNKYICEDLIAAEATSFLTYSIYGYVKSHSTKFRGSHTLDFALVTRRSRFRAGTRYFRRGIDEDGSVANFNETEQIFTSHEGQIYSFLQTRGSVPVYWTEINNLKYKPNLVISTRSSADATAQHFKEQVDLYQDNYLVNLVNQSGYEEPVKRAYENAVQSLPEPLAKHVKYIYFDFHHECRKMRWDRVRLLIEQLKDLGFESDNYFLYDSTTRTVKHTQTKIVRTNCMDCLDRTNVVQSMLGRWMLQNQLEKAHYLPEASATSWEVADPRFNFFFQGFWADNADAVSCAYSGTGALKTDYTRTGKRTKMGALSDLNNSITRYYLNNYKDGHRQDSYDLFLGKYRPYRDSIANPFIDRRPPYNQLVPYLIGASFVVLVALLAYPRGSLSTWKNIAFVAGCIYFGFYNISFVVKNGYQFVDWPQLSPLDFLKKTDVVDSDGKFIGITYEENENFKTSKKRI